MRTATTIKTLLDDNDLTLLLVTTTPIPKRGTRLHEKGTGEDLICKANSSRCKKDMTKGR
jgi:hypothetical protein